MTLPEQVRKGSTDILTTVYDATGRKWKKTSTVDILDEYNQPSGSTYTETRVYVNGVEFSGEGTGASQIASINASSNGRVAYNYDTSTGAPAGSRVEYYHTDHLGNVRLAFSDLDGDGVITVQDIYDPTNEITQERHYYPYGLTHTGAWFATVSPEDQYRYNGKELDEATGHYFYGFRMYDPAIARFTGVDPIADQFAWVSPYNYAENEPVGHIDLWGLQKAKPRNDAQNLVIVIQGYHDQDPPDGRTQANNNPNSYVDYPAIGRIARGYPEGETSNQVVVFSSTADSDNTINDVAGSIDDFTAAHPEGKIVLVGHSQGAANAMQAADKTDASIDLLVTLDIEGYNLSSTVPSNVREAVNIYQENSTILNGGPVTAKNSASTTVRNYRATHATHQKIDNEFVGNVINLIEQVTNVKSNHKIPASNRHEFIRN